MEQPAPQQLVFFDTFTHESPTEISLDLIQFPSPVRISEIRVIPLGARVTAKFPNGDRLGATNPSTFEVSFFVNNLALSSSHSTFTKLGSLSYKQNVNTALPLEGETAQIPTDGLLIRGAYNTLTIAVIGRITDNESIRVQSEESVKAQTAVPVEVESNAKSAEPEVKPEPPKESSTTESDQLSHFLEDLSNSPSRSNLSIKGSLVSASPFEDEDSPGDIAITDASKSKDTSDATTNDQQPREPAAESFLDTDLQEILSPEVNCDDAQEDFDSISDGELEPIPIDTQENEGESFVAAENKSPVEAVKAVTDDATEDLEQISSGDEDIFVKSDSVADEESNEAAIVCGDKDSNFECLIFFDPSTSNLNMQLDDSFDPCFHGQVSKKSFPNDDISLIFSMNDRFSECRDRWADAIDHLISKYTVDQLEDHWDFLLQNLDRGLRDHFIESPSPAAHTSVSKIRQIKTCLKLLIFLLQNKSKLTERLVEMPNIWSSVLEIYHEKNVSLPICLQVLSVFDPLTMSLAGIKFSIEKTINFSQGPLTLYQWILKEILKQSSSRILSILQRLLQRANLFHFLVESTRVFSSSTNEDTEKLFDLLENLLLQLKLCILFSKQPLHLIPAGCVFAFDENVETNLPCLLEWFDDLNLFKSLVNICQIEQVKPLVGEVMNFIATLPNGLTFMLTGSRSQSTAAIIGSLLSCPDDKSNESIVQLAYSLHGNYLLKNLHSSQESFEKYLYQLHFFLLDSSNHSLTALINLFTDDNCLSQLIDLLFKCKSIASIQELVIIDLILEVIRFRSVKVEKLISIHSENVIKLSHRITFLREAPDWISSGISHTPIEYTKEYFSSICKAIKSESDTAIASGCSCPSLITLLRLTKEAAIDESTDLIKFETLTQQLKYDYAIVKLFSHDMLQTLVTLVDSLTSNSHYGHIDKPFNFTQLTLLTLEACIPLIHAMICALIRVRGKNFKDCTPLKPLLKSYAFIQSQQCSKLTCIIDKVSKEVIEIISLYTQLLPDFEPSTNVSTSLWCKTLNECIEFALSAPRFFYSGLSILNQLMPLPLPISVPSSIDTVNPSHPDVIHLLNMRKIWALHVHPVSKQLEQMISHLAICCDVNVQRQLVHLCVKLCDLSLTSALTVAQGILNVFDSINDQAVSLCQWFSLLLSLSKFGSFKTTFLYVAFKSHSSTSSVPTKFTPESCFFHQISPWIEKKDDTVLMICKNLCDARIKLASRDEDALQETANNLPPKESLMFLTQQLTSDAKSATATVASIQVLITLAKSSDLGQLIVTTALNECNFINITLNQIHQALNNESIKLLESLVTLLQLLWSQDVIDNKYTEKLTQIGSLVSKWEGEVSGVGKNGGRFDCSPPVDDSYKYNSNSRGKIVSAGETSGNIGKFIDRLLQQQVRTDKAPVKTPLNSTLPRPEPLSVIFQRRTLLTHSLTNNYHLDITGNTATTCSSFSPSSTSSSPFSSSSSPHSVCNTSVAATTTATSNSHHQLTVDLIELSASLFPHKSFDLSNELTSLLARKSTATDDQLNRQRRTFTRKEQLSQQQQLPFSRERLMVAPTRGRSSGPPGSKDPFRSRPPNTSRPPSMHVDDFVAMEQRGSSVAVTSAPSDALRGQRGRNKDKRSRKVQHRGSSRDLSLPAARFASSRGFPGH